MQREFIVVDGFNLIFHMFFAVPPMHTKTGQPANALFGYTKALMKLLATDAAYIVMAFDSGGDTFRSEIDPEYKAQRDGMPSDLATQMEAIFEVTKLLQIPAVAVPGFEADDIIGTLVRRYEKDMERTMIVSSDKDLFQFIGGTTYVMDAMKDILYDREEAIKKFEVEPNQIVDYLALIGDTSDNIPGVRWIGPKTAVKLLKDYGTLTNILEHISELSPKLQSLIDDGESARKSQLLATIRLDVPLTLDLLDVARARSGVQFTPELVTFLKQYEFRSLLPTIVDGGAPVFRGSPATPLDATNIENIWSRIAADTPYTLASSWDPTLESLAIAFSREEVYELTPTHFDASEFLSNLVHNPHQITTYDWKNTLRRIAFLRHNRSNILTLL